MARSKKIPVPHDLWQGDGLDITCRVHSKSHPKPPNGYILPQIKNECDFAEKLKKFFNLNNCSGSKLSRLTTYNGEEKQPAMVTKGMPLDPDIYWKVFFPKEILDGLPGTPDEKLAQVIGWLKDRKVNYTEFYSPGMSLEETLQAIVDKINRPWNEAIKPTNTASDKISKKSSSDKADGDEATQNNGGILLSDKDFECVDSLVINNHIVPLGECVWEQVKIPGCGPCHLLCGLPQDLLAG